MKLLFLFLPLLWTFSLYAQEVPSNLEFITLRTQHFDVIVNARQQELGVLYAEKLEEAYDFLDPLFTSKPERTIVIINDKTDVTNGSATPLPYAHIMIYPALPGPSDSLGEHGDWALELLTHEYTHILSFYPSHGLIRGFRYIFGNIIVPNALMPKWWLEGVAVHTETKVSSGGRLRSRYQDAVVRSFVKAGKLSSYTIDQANETLPSWPQGHRPYLFGSLLWSQMESEQGEKIVGTLHERQGGRLPFFIEGPAKDHLGRSYVEEYDHMLQETEKRAQQQLQKLNEKPINKLEFINIETAYLDFSSISPDGRYMAVVSIDETLKREIKILERAQNRPFLEAKLFEKIESQKDSEVTPPPQDAPPTGSIERVSWFNKSPKLVYDKVDSINKLERFSDLHMYDLITQKSEQLTTGLRAREPSVSPDDQEIVFVKLEGGRTALGILDIASKTSKVVWTPRYLERISYPSFLDKNRIVFAFRQPSGEEKLWIFHRDTGKTEKILNQFETSRFPLLTPKGLVFTSAKNGIHNLYLADKNLTNAKSISHLDSISFSASWDSQLNDFYLATLTENGPQVARLSEAEWQKTPSSLPVVSRLLEDRYPFRQPRPKKDVVTSTEPYSSTSNLWPHYWLPYFFTSATDGSLLLGALTEGHDPLKKHAYAMSASYHTGIKALSGSGVYRNTQFAWPFSLASAYTSSYLVSPENVLKNIQNSFSFSPDIWSFHRNMALDLGVIDSRDESELVRSSKKGVFSTISYSDVGLPGPAQISPESGKAGYLQATRYFESTENPYTQYKFGGLYYFSSWFPARHALVTRLNGFYVHEEILTISGGTSSAYNSAPDALTSTYVMRGYLSGHFQGKKLYNLNTEYRFPLYRVYKGRGTDPYFIRVLHGALVADGLTLDGFAYNVTNQTFDRVYPGKVFWSAGVELKLESTIGYTVPITLVLGYYSALTPDYGPKSGLAVSLSGFSF